MSTATDTEPVEAIDPGLNALFGIISRKQARSILRSAEATIALWVGAVSAGKTFASLIAFLIAIRKVPLGERIVIVGVTLKTIEGNIITPLQDPKIFGRISSSVIHTTGASFAIILGRYVELIGAPNALATAKITGATIALAYVDEAVLIPAEFWRMLVTRLRTANAHMIATTNPASANHWLLREYIKAKQLHDMVVFHFTMRDNPLYFPGGAVGPSYILRMVRSNVGMFFQRFILGLWTNAVGAIYDMFDRDIHVIRWEDMPRIDRILCVGIDYGASHATSAVMLGISAEVDARGRPAPRLIVMDEWRHKVDPVNGIPSMAPSDMATEIGKWLKRFHTPGDELALARIVFVDPSAKGFRDELMKARIPNVAADNDVTRGIAAVSSLLAQRRIVITDRCDGILEEITEYRWDPKKTLEGEDEPLKEKDDSVDAMRYAIFSTYSIWSAIFKAAYGLAA